MSSNLHLNFFELKVRRSGSQPSIFVRTFGLFTMSLLTGGVFANILTISVKPLSSFDGFAFWSFSDLL